MTDRHTADSITSDALDQLYERLARAERAVRRAEGSEGRMAKHLARQDSRVNGLTRDRDRQRDRADRAEATLARVRAEADVIERGVLGDHDVTFVCRVAAQRIRAALDEPAPVSSGPAATQATEAVRQMDADTTEPHTGLVVQPYTVHGERKWVFRCWGTDTCDGWLSLDHYNEQSATRARDRHAAEEHPNEEQH